MRTALLLAIVAAAPAVRSQTPPVVDAGQDAKAFLGGLKSVLRTDKAPRRITSFSATVTVNIRTKDRDVDIDNATIDYLWPRYLKTTIRESGRTIVRATSDLAPWMMKDEKAYFISGKEYGEDRKSLYRDLSIAAAMTRYLYPDRELTKLSELRGPAEVPLKWGRSAAVPAYRISGVAPDGTDYPLALTMDHRGPVRVIAWFRKADRFPLAVRLIPLDRKTKKRSGPIEEFRFLAHQRRDELLLPVRMLFSASPAKSSKLTTLQTIRLKRFEANPSELKPDNFAKPK